MKAVKKTIVRFSKQSSALQTLTEVKQAIKQHRHCDPHSELDLSLSQLLSFDSLLNIQAAVTLLHSALLQQQRIIIIGDFDTDGATSTAVAASALRLMGAKHVDYLVPNRFKFGYGLTPEIVAVAQTFQPDLLITVDNGIASLEGVAAAKAAGMRVLITDHHLPAATLPDADAIINPNQVGDLFPSKNLAGVGVIFYVMLALRAHLRTVGWFAQQGLADANLSQLLDLVALGTVADVVPLDHNNRILVHQGLQRIRAQQCRPGIQALMALSKKKLKDMQATDLGFIIAPRLNAAGRLEDMALGINCLLAPDSDSAHQLAQRLDLLNQERRTIEAEMQLDAHTLLQQLSFESKHLPLGLCVYQAHWHQGVTGIIAARLKDRYARPSIAFARVDDGTLKGSARSVNGLNIRDLLDSINTKQPSLIQRFGGHAMAAGVSLTEANFPAFEQAYLAELALCFSNEQIATILYSDGELASSVLQLSTASEVQRLGPYGQAFPEPLFDGTFALVDQRLVGGKHLKITVKTLDGAIIDGIAFNIELNEWPNHHARQVHIAYHLGINEFRDRQNLQFIIQSLHAC